MKLIKVVILILLLLVSFLYFSRQIIFPSDILNYLPSYANKNWESPKNSLLSDPLFQFEPWRIYAKERILNLELPLINPYNAAGTPFLANPQAAFLYPLNLFYYLLPVSVSLNLIPLLKLSLLFFFTFIYLKKIRCSDSASLIGTLITTFSAFPIQWLLWPHSNVFILLPLLLYLTELLKEENSRRALYGISLVYFIGITAGHPETLLHIGIVHFIYSVIRLFRMRALLLIEAFFVTVGFALGAFLLLPFIEYVFNSYMFSMRTSMNSIDSLPLFGLVYYFFPFLLGGPHLQYYRPPLGTNFQEIAGGYSGSVIFVIGLLSVILGYKNRYIKIFSGFLIAVFVIVYNIWPFWLIKLLPPFNITANNRLVGFVGFFLGVIIAIFLSQANKSFLKNIGIKNIILIAFLAILICIPSLRILQVVLQEKFPIYAETFIPFLVWQGLYFYISSILALTLFVLGFNKNSHYLMALGVLLAVVTQMVIPFGSYNTVTKVSSYYPTNKFITKLQSLPPGRILEIGNPALPPNINLAYKLENAQSDDAINVKEYIESFNQFFPIKNHWGRVDRVNELGLSKFGIRYLISDYNPNLHLENLQSKQSQIINLTNKDSVDYKFIGNGKVLRQVRLITATYNRNNNCALVATVRSHTENISTKVDCRMARDLMFLTIDVGSIVLKKSSEYTLTLRTEPRTSESIGIKGEMGKPYIDILTTQDNSPYKILYKEDGVYISEFSSSLVSGVSRYSVTQDTPEKIKVKLFLDSEGAVEIKKTYYPGWSALIDGKPTRIFNSKPFIGINLPKGEHEVSILYAPYSLKLGLFISAVSSVFLLFYIYKVEKK